MRGVAGARDGAGTMQPVGNITIASAFNGPPTSGNGGYASGVLSRLFETPHTVRISAPIPLDTPLAVTQQDNKLVAAAGEKPILTARPGGVTLTPPAAPAPPARPPEGAYAEHLSAPAESLATARLAVAYHSLGNRTDAETAGRALALAVDPGEEESPGFVPRAQRAAAAWTADAGAGARREVVEPDGTTRFLDVGDNYNFYYQF